jgi:hypothetical protein
MGRRNTTQQIIPTFTNEMQQIIQIERVDCAHTFCGNIEQPGSIFMYLRSSLLGGIKSYK